MHKQLNLRKWYLCCILPDFGAIIGSQSLATNFISLYRKNIKFSCFVRYCTQNKLIIDYPPVYPYKAEIRLKFTVSIRLTAVNITAVNL